MKNTCSQCRFKGDILQAQPDPNAIVQLERFSCVRYPPTVAPVVIAHQNPISGEVRQAIQMLPVQAVTHAEHWCGEFAPQEVH